MQEKSMNAKRGYVPEDEKNFSPEAIEKMKIASHQYRLIPETADAIRLILDILQEARIPFTR